VSPVIWSPTVFALVDALPKGQTLNSLHFSEAIRTTVHTKFPNSATEGRYLVHMDNARPIKNDTGLSESFRNISGGLLTCRI
jgi:hypothetical protein